MNWLYIWLWKRKNPLAKCLLKKQFYDGGVTLAHLLKLSCLKCLGGFLPTLSVRYKVIDKWWLGLPYSLSSHCREQDYKRGHCDFNTSSLLHLITKDICLSWFLCSPRSFFQNLPKNYIYRKAKQPQTLHFCMPTGPDERTFEFWKNKYNFLKRERFPWVKLGSWMLCGQVLDQLQFPNALQRQLMHTTFQ